MWWPRPWLHFSFLLGKRVKDRVKDSPYESGIAPTGSARERFSVKFYLVAIVFILFDIEAVFLYPWAVVYRELKMFGFVEMLLFVVLVLVGILLHLEEGRAGLVADASEGSPYDAEGARVTNEMLPEHTERPCRWPRRWTPRCRTPSRAATPSATSRRLLIAPAAHRRSLPLPERRAEIRPLERDHGGGLAAGRPALRGGLPAAFARTKLSGFA